MPRLFLPPMMLIAFSASVAAAELPAKPESVLPYLETLYKSGDIDAYADLLTSDYKFMLEDMGATWNAEADVKGTRKLFESASAELSFPRDVSVKPGPQPGTWIIEDVAGSLKVTQKKDGKVFRVENTFTFVIRDEGGKLRIAEWRQKPEK